MADNEPYARYLRKKYNEALTMYVENKTIEMDYQNWDGHTQALVVNSLALRKFEWNFTYV